MYGGINGESKEYLKDFRWFDLETMNWKKVKITFADETETLSELAMHSMSNISFC